MVGNIEIGVCFWDRMVYLVVNILLMSAGGPVEIGGQFNVYVYNQNMYVTVVFESVEKKIANGECMSERMSENYSFP